MTEYVLDEFAQVTPGDPFRLFPFGKLVKGGKEREITPDFARKFKLPHFRPPIKRGTHQDDAPAVGWITGLEVREDGLYAVPEWNEEGLEDVEKGRYRYQSPEVIFDEADGFEDPETGKLIQGPLIVGDAILHRPHLGESTAFFTAVEKETPMSDEYVQIDKGFWAKVQERLFPADEPVTPEPAPAPAPEEFEALQAKAQKAEEYEAELEKLRADQERRGRIEHFVTALEETHLEGEVEAAERLAGLDEDEAEWVIEQFKALQAQIAENDELTKEIGSSKTADPDATPQDRLNAAVEAKMAEDGLNYVAAFEAVRAEQPELFEA